MTKIDSSSTLAGATAVLTAALALAIPGRVSAQTLTSGAYIGASGALQWRGTATDVAAATTFKRGFAINGMLGYRVDKHIRVEGEYSHLNNGNETATAGMLHENASGNISLNAYMVSAYYDFNVGHSRIRPYLGGGIGTYQSQINSLTTPTLLKSNIVVIATSPNLFAYQWRAGIGYAVSPRTEVYLGYRQFKGGHLRFDVAGLGTLRPNGPHTDHIEVGIRFLL
jgi:opacity protein-like surface antigen